MTRASDNLRQTAAVGRLVCRALTVAGGVAAGTALAWWLSTSAASAEVRDAPDTRVPEQVSSVLEDVALVHDPVEQVVETVAQYLRDPPPEDVLADLGEKAATATGHVPDQHERGITDCALCPVAKVVEDVRAHRTGGFGQAIASSVANMTIVGIGAEGLEALTVDAGPDTDGVEHRLGEGSVSSAGVARHGSPEPVRPVSPDLPDWPAPFSPIPGGVPNAGTASTGAVSTTSIPIHPHVFAEPLLPSRAAAGVGGVVTPTDSVTFGRPGAQPGVAPD